MDARERAVFEELRRAASIMTKHAGRPLVDPRVLAAIPFCVRSCNAAERILDPLRSMSERRFVESEEWDDPNASAPWSTKEVAT